jgi:hypothetical protein
MPSDIRGDRITIASGTSDPSSGSTGQVYFKTSDKSLYVYNGTIWSNGGVVYGDLGTADNPAASPDQLNSAGKPTGVYYLKSSGVTYKTYVIMGIAGGNWGLAMGIHNPGDSGFGYNGTYWNSLGELNVSDANLNITAASSADLNVMTRMIDTYSATSCLITFRYRDGNYANYITGSSTDGVSRITTTRSTTGQGFTLTKTGTDPLGNQFAYNYNSNDTSGDGGPGRKNEWIWNASQSGFVQSGGVSYARFGQANRSELFNGAYYSSNARGVGLRSANNCGGNEIERGGGFTNARHSAGGCGDNPSTSADTSVKFEVWLK